MAHIQTSIDASNEGVIIDVECTQTRGLPAIVIVGFANKAVEEAKERIRAAFASSKLELPRRRITINLAPADIPKDGTSFDLAMATAILVCALPSLPDPIKDCLIFGELSLDGQVRPVRGIIGKLRAAKQLGYQRFIIPAGNREQAALVGDITLLPVTRLQDVYQALTGGTSLPELSGGSQRLSLPQPRHSYDFQDVVGQQRAKRALEIAAAGGHNILISGPPGTGKSMLAKALPSILPALSLDEILEVTHLHSLASRQYDKLITERPFRAPHHSASETSIIGGGNRPKPGEISLAHHGVLFLDELPEYSRPTLEALRQPLEDQTITITRAHDSLTFPASFILVATANPCPCGYYASSKPCTCKPSQIQHYQQKLSGPIMDRIDLYIEAEEIRHEALLAQNSRNDTSQQMHKRVETARQQQLERFQTSLKTNAQLTNKEIKTLVGCSVTARQLLNTAAERLGLSARAYMRTLKVSRTIADLEQSPGVEIVHLTEALQYRRQSIRS